MAPDSTLWNPFDILVARDPAECVDGGITNADNGSMMMTFFADRFDSLTRKI